MSALNIPFNKPYISGNEFKYISEVERLGKFSGDGEFTGQCNRWLERNTGCFKSLLTPSCTSALEMSALLLDIEEGDEIIMPSYTFVSTANAFVLRGGVPVFVDIREDTLNIDERLISAAITEKTKAIVPVHYAGVGCEMDVILKVAKQHGIDVVEDAAQGVMSYYNGRALGSLGTLGTFSFHDTKNIIAGEGGALLVNDEKHTVRAEIIREKGTNRSLYLRGAVDKYTWQGVGSSYLPSEITAAFLFAQLEEASNITAMRLASWEYYHCSLAELESQGLLRRPIIPENCAHNAHMYYVLLDEKTDRQFILDEFKRNFIISASHYEPLHSSPAGKHYGRVHDSMSVTEVQSKRLIRLPLWAGLTEGQQEKVIEVLVSAISTQNE